jgi:hypothetical protein
MTPRNWGPKCRSFLLVRQMRDARLVSRVARLFSMGNMWVPNGWHALIRRVALLFLMGNTWVPNGQHILSECVAL